MAQDHQTSKSRADSSQQTQQQVFYLLTETVNFANMLIGVLDEF